MKDGRIALISASIKDGIEEIAKKLVGMGFEVLATEGTAEYLRAKGVEVRKTSEVTGLAERRELKTLHNRLYEMIFSGQIKVVIAIPYNFEERPSFENIDIGGICLIRAAAKAGALVAFDIESAKEVVETLETGSDEIRRRLICKAFRFTSSYDAKIAEWLSEGCDETPDEAPRI